MRILLTTLNARFSHTSLALRYIRGVLRQIPGISQELKEYTINQPADDILSDIYKGGYDCVCFSTYIWNVELILRISANLKKVAPEIRILLGGPEVSWAPAAILKNHPYIDGLILGEGEDIVRTLFTQGFEKPGWQSVAGTAWNTEAGMRVNPGASLIQDLGTIPFPYGEEDDFNNRLVYYESSRGCPYRCSYCLSSAHEGVRFFPLPRVFSDLTWLLTKNIQTVKFVDRTFNVNPAHYLPILEFIQAHDNGRTCFHFEISAGVLTPEVIMLCAGFRKGLVQFEIGVQSTCPEALKASGRPDWTGRIREHVHLLQQPGNIHLHLDLIAGLPYEGYDRFLESFDAVYAMKPDMLQLGFLKLIHGTAMRRNAEYYGFQWREEPPYEVLSTKWLSYAELCALKRVEHLLDRYYQHGRLEKTLARLEERFPRPSALYTAMDAWWEAGGHWNGPVGQEESWLLLYEFASQAGVPEHILRACMRWDILVHYKPRAFAGTALGTDEPSKELQHDLLHGRDQEAAEWSPYAGLPAKQLLKRLHFEIFRWDPLRLCPLNTPAVFCFDTSESPSRLICQWPLPEIIKEEKAGNSGSMGNY